jgi:hypothetical protein
MKALGRVPKKLKSRNPPLRNSKGEKQSKSFFWLKVRGSKFVPKIKSALGNSKSKIDSRTLNSIPGDDETKTLKPSMNPSRQSLGKKIPNMVEAPKKSVQFSNYPGVENPLAPSSIIPVPADFINDDSYSDGDEDKDIIKSAIDLDTALNTETPNPLDPEPPQEPRRSITEMLGLGFLDSLEA